ncbi:MAG TPA: hypothetical protein VNT60_02490 [Deinococcales bacterium]|nr:hypothetical protein [Deinococcales bacterium]
MKDDITGRLGGPSDGHDIRCRMDGDTVRGRIGGALMARELTLDINTDGVNGKVGGTKGFDVSLRLDGGELVGQVGREDLRLRGVDRVAGRVGDTIGGVDVIAVQRGQKISGRVGGIAGKAFELELGEAPGWVGALVAAVTYYALERH